MPQYNIGEIDELKAVLTLIYHRDHGSFTNVGYGINHNYQSHNLTLENIKLLDNDSTISIAHSCGITKAAASYKADVYINNIGYSLKSNRGAKPALLNHTHRDGLIKVLERLGENINSLDILVDNYWAQRLAGVHSEDVRFKDSAFNANKALMIKILEYFMFIGTARGNSLHPAQYLYSFSDPTDIKTWLIYSPNDAANNIIDNTIISIRNKGLPPTYQKNSVNKQHIKIHPWVKTVDGCNKGCIHIRF
ncbi:hypothetical protein [Photobacterium damselae]|uniref:hypothetical protein n=1 Tax=Photobacterium damselae TaxID=38293 RepID=UPI0015949893|nr:hypothetical protein [Photobacterium damselae]NVH48988.1 hypothetical protein [Photobacterium damselae subsp. damselae]